MWLRLSKISRTCGSAGVMPGVGAAWPMLAGRMWPSFSWPSMLSAFRPRSRNPWYDHRFQPGILDDLGPLAVDVAFVPGLDFDLLGYIADDGPLSWKVGGNPVVVDPRPAQNLGQVPGFAYTRLRSLLEWAWQMAMARASAASSGLGGEGRLRRRWIMYWICFLSALP